MTPAQRKRYEQKLEALRTEALAEKPAKIEPNRKDPSAVGVADEDEQALSEMMQTLASQRNRQQAERVAQIDRALKRLRNEPDEFGLCEDCEEEIGDKRLSLMPFATLCLECQAKRDPKRGKSRKSLTDYK
jgi:DnaK suppressor protein